MRYLPILFLVLACSPGHKELPDYSLPSELRDCKVFRISNGGISDKALYVVKCPNATTTTSWSRTCGKNCSTTEHATLVQE